MRIVHRKREKDDRQKFIPRRHRVVTTSNPALNQDFWTDYSELTEGSYKRIFDCRSEKVYGHYIHNGPCEHSALTLSWNRSNMYFASIYPTAKYENWLSSPVIFGQMYDGSYPFPYQLTSIPDFDLSNFLARAYEAMKPTMRGKLNLFVFLMELREIGQMLEVITKKYHELKTLWKRGNDQFLSYQFGWKPMVSDIGKILLAVLDFNANWNRFCEMQGKWITRHYREVIEVDALDSGIKNGSLWPYYKWRQQRTAFTVNVNAHMSFRYVIPNFKDPSTRIRALLDQLGLVRGWESLWELTPFSFVVDWIVDVGKFLALNSKDSTPIEMELGDFSYSYKLEYTDYATCIISGYTPALNETFINPISTWTQLYRQDYKFYKRAQALPQLNYQIELGSGLKWLLSASLLTGVLYKGRKRR